MQPVIPHLGEKLPIALLPAEEAGAQDPRAVRGKERAHAVKLGREDLEHDEGKGELGEGGADVGALKGALGRPHLDQFVVGEDDGDGAVLAQVVPRVVAHLEKPPLVSSFVFGASSSSCSSASSSSSSSSVAGSRERRREGERGGGRWNYGRGGIGWRGGGPLLGT